MRAIPDDNLSYPVSIALDSGNFGSGFMLNTSSAQFLVTAKHVLFDNTGTLLSNHAKCVAYANDLTTRLDMQLDLRMLQTGGAIATHATADVAIIKTGTLAPTGAGARSVTFERGFVMVGVVPPGCGTVGLTLGACRMFRDLKVANDIYIFGFPNSVGQKGQLDRSRPLLRKGIVAGTNQANETIIVDCPVYQGNSGGLVVEVSLVAAASGIGFEYKGIGVVKEFVPFFEEFESLQFGTKNLNVENSGYAVVTPMDRVFELIPTTAR